MPGPAFRLFAAIALALSAAAPGLAQAPAAPAAEGDRWIHQRSGASLPRSLGGQTITESRDLGNPYNSVAVYSGPGSAVESTTIYIFRTAIPDARLWFDRALPSVARNIPLAIFEAGPAEQFAAFAAPAPNGLYRIYTTSQQGPFRSTAIAVAQAGEWIVKIRLSSATLDRAAMAARIVALTDAIRFPAATVRAALSAPIADCARPAADGTGRPIALDEEVMALGLGGGLILQQRARQPLGSNEAGWCRDPAVAAEAGTLLRHGEGHWWIALIGDAGIAISALAGPAVGLPEDRHAIVYAISPAFLRGTAAFDAMPSTIAALQAGAPTLAGRSEGLFEIQIGPGSEPQR